MTDNEEEEEEDISNVREILICGTLLGIWTSAMFLLPFVFFNNSKDYSNI